MNHSPFSSPEEFQRFVENCRHFEDALKKGERPNIEEELAHWPEGDKRSYVHNELIGLEQSYRDRPDGQANSDHQDSNSTKLPNSSSSASTQTYQPTHFGRYRVEKVLGEGGFGRVYLAHDDQLGRTVAIKVPRADRISRQEDVEAYLTEARTLASLNHPHIVPVYDVGRTDDGLCFVVSKFIEGSDLSKKIKETRPTFQESSQLVATVAEALHYAHGERLVHRDIKPANILLDKSGKPHVADFGLALKEAEFGKGAGFAGTPAYMSPEQANGEGHRVDGRSDIFSLGVVLYELLVGRRPFKADSQAELLEQIASVEVRPPRQVDDKIPKELERICIKALAKRATERYTTAKDMADDLTHFLAEQVVNQQLTPAPKESVSPSATPIMQPPSSAGVLNPSGTSSTVTPPISDSQQIKIVPKGLRSFDSHDADFFLELLPGPRDRKGLPDSIRFWKTRIEEMDPDNTFSVGLIYGPSGCGKSSLMKAGLLPRLSADMLAVYVEATAGETEARLLNGLRKRCPALPANLGLKETLAMLRRGKGIPAGKKVLIVLDQFEQWLHAKKEEENTELVQALRQCDGNKVQCVVMVRDDFWMAATRFMRELEIRLLEGQNSAPVDLFPMRHAEKVLAAFGRAFGVLPESAREASKEQQQFIEQAVSGLAQEGKVICVRLALFAEMMKGKAWTPASLKAVGGTEGVGVTFLEETFSASTAPPEHRYHQKAARANLNALLPETGSDIKGHMRSYAELLEASGYGSRPKDFDDLVRILDNEIRLITPTDPEGKEGADESTFKAKPGQKYYQLTHDYLVHSLREWLTRKQKETRRGQAELLLADRAGVWNARPENRQLPSLWQWFSIRFLTQKKNWTPLQRKMMRKAGKVHAVRVMVVALILTMIGLGSWEGYGRLEGRRLRDRLLEATTPDVPGIVKDMAGYRRWVDPLLQDAYSQAETEKDSRKQLHASLALLPVESGQVEYLFGRLLKGEPQEVLVIREALLIHKEDLTERLWTLLENPKNEQDQRLRAACALAVFAPDDARWEKVGPDVAATLVNQEPFVIAQWKDSLKGVGGWLIPPLADFLVDENRSLSAKGLIAKVYGTYAADMPDAYARLETQLAEKSEPNVSAEAKVALAKRQAGIGVALLVMGRGEQVCLLLKHSLDPTLRSCLMERLGPGGVDPKRLTARLEEEKEVSVKRAILLSLGEFGLDSFSQDKRLDFLPRLLQMYQDDPDPGIHGAAEWLLRQWGQQAKLKALDDKLRTTEGQLNTVLKAPLTEEKKQRSLKLISEIENIQTQLTESEKTLSLRQNAWEQKLREQFPASLQEGLIAHYPLDETKGTETANAVKDQPGGKYRGTGEPEWVPGVMGRALRLDGKGDILGGSPLDVESDQAFSYGCWFRYEGKPAMILISNRDRKNGYRGFDLSLEPVKDQPGCALQMAIVGENPNYPKSDPKYYFNKTYSLQSITVATATSVTLEPPPSRWHHVLVTYDGSKKAIGVQIYVDGKPQPITINNDKLEGTIKSDLGIHLGSRDGSYQFRGVIDDMRIYNRSLLADEVAQLYKSGIQALEHRTAKERNPEDESLQRLTGQLTAAQKSLREMETDWFRRWYVNGQGQTMMVVPKPGEFWMGVGTERHRSQIGRSFAISSKEVTVEQFRTIIKPDPSDKDYSPTSDCPAMSISWYDAAEYCNQLSKQENIPEKEWCYIPNKDGKYGDGMKMALNYLQRTGYRLPTEAEWEYACRAGAETEYSFGEAEEFLGKYAWFTVNSFSKSHPVGLLKPNDLGLYDMHGNAWEWTQDAYKRFANPGGGKAIVDREDFLDINGKVGRVLRGGSFYGLALHLRSANRDLKLPAYRNSSVGFRPARTLPP